MHEPAALLAVHGHPDDEVFLGGGTLARYAAEGVRVVAVTGTRGELGEIVVRDLDTPQHRASLGEIRLQELERALGVLGVTEQRWLGFRDSGMHGTAANDDPQAFCRCDVDEAVGRLVRIIREVRPQVIITHNEGGGDGHPDHITAARVARLAFDRAGDAAAYAEQLEGPGALECWAPDKLYEEMDQVDRREKLRRLVREQGIIRAAPVALRALSRWRPAREQERARAAATIAPPTARIDVRPWLEARHRALLEFRSQVAFDDDIVAMSPEDRARVMPTENFRLRSSRVAAPEAEDDLFTGLRGRVTLGGAVRPSG